MKIALLVVVSMACAPAALADVACGLDARNSHNVPLPVIAPEAMPPALAAEIRRGFELVYLQFRSADAERQLLIAVHHAQQAHNACAEGLATFGTAQAARNTHLADAMPRFLRAAELLQPVATPLTMAYVHERLTLVATLTGDTSKWKPDWPALQREFHDDGDEATAIYERSSAQQRAPGQTEEAYQAGLFDELARVDAPNALMARGFVQYMWGKTLDGRGLFPAAMQHFRLAVHSLRACDCGPTTLGAVYLEMSFVASKQDSSAVTLGYALQSDQIYKRFHLESSRPQSLRVVGVAYMQRKQFDRGIAAYQQGLNLANKQHATMMTTTLVILLAQAYSQQGHPEASLALMKEYEPLLTQPEHLCARNVALGIVETDAKLWKQAETHLRYFVDTCKDGTQPTEYATSLSNLAVALMKQGKLEEALNEAQMSVSTLEQERRLIDTTDRNHMGFDALLDFEYSVLIDVLEKLHRPEEAMMVSEQFRARPFLDLVNSPHERLQTDAEVAAAAKAMPKGGVGGGDLLAETAANRKSVSQTFTLTIDDIRKTVEQTHTTLISYWVQEGELSTWVMAPGKPLTQTVVPFDHNTEALVDATLPKNAEGTRGGRVRTRGGRSDLVAAGDSKPWRALYRVLIEPIEAQLPKEAGSQITIVPQGKLFQLSFAALQDRDGHYLLEKHAINTVPAAGMLQVTARNEAAAALLPPEYLLIGNPDRFPAIAGSPLPALPGTASEVRDISRRLSGVPVTLLTGKHAGVDEMTASLPSITSLHFATHAVVSDETPMSSFLALDRSQQGGKLTAADVYGLHLHASLVVLSACGTGRGKISGDGVAGLSRAFFYAGAASLVTTLWDVVDEPTARLMPMFYSGLARGEHRSAALRNAQLSLLADLRAHRVRVQTLSGARLPLPDSPAYWAAFSLSGQP